ncbi:MAG: hypothetical protein IPJ58_08500 [Ardenticatenia bacterium]|nr:hypothetical protein [Ardenticatenia bacterium]
MPLYDYACRVCDNSFEIRQSYQEEPLTECPRCHGEIRRVINQVGLVFKGGGYYITDSRPAGASGSATAVSDDAGNSEGSEKPTTANGEHEGKAEDKSKDRNEGAEGRSGESPADTAAKETPASGKPSSPPASSPTVPGAAPRGPSAPSIATPPTTGGSQGSTDSR